ncbi:hypothetical protein ACOME3_002251 [Neoechinorhynchus agilis]
MNSNQRGSQLPLKFMTEEDVQKEHERRRKEWERVRTSGDPLEAPCSVFDTRSLFEKLREQQVKQQTSLEEQGQVTQHRGLDEDEAHFLTSFYRLKNEQERRMKTEDEHEIQAFREFQSSSKKEAVDVVKLPDSTKTLSSRKRQAIMISKAIKRTTEKNKDKIYGALQNLRDAYGSSSSNEDEP